MDSYILNLDPQLYFNIASIILAILVVLSIVQFIFIICLIISLSKVKKRLKNFLPSNKNMDMEDMLVTYNKNVKEVLLKEQEILDKIESNRQSLSNEIESTNKLIYLTNKKLKNAVQKVSIIRYNPFDEVGGDLCYAIALLDESNNGIVINSIYSREACYSYAKEIINGESPKHKLAKEEIEALNIAMNK